jgi:hypothetical protein
MSDRQNRWLCVAGLFPALLGLYLLTTPGRIDTIDGQWRYDVARNWLDTGQPVVADPYLLATRLQLLNRGTGKSYAPYNAAPSLAPIPLMAISRLLPGHSAERDRFAFTLAGPLFGSLLGALLLVGYGWLGVRLRDSLIYTTVFCVATLWWPASVTVFDQNQHAVLLLGAALTAWQSGRRQSLCLAGLAGLLAGLLLDYQEVYTLALPALGLAVLACPEEGSPDQEATLQRTLDRAALLRLASFGLCCCVGLVLFIAFNEVRFGTPLVLAKYGRQDIPQPPIWGNPLAGLLSLAISPGKGILWFSPPLLLTCLGARRFFHRAPALALTVAGVSMCYLLVIIHLTFFGGDWCWGPRYAIPVMPLWALAFPFAAARAPKPRLLIAPLLGVGLLVQLMGVSLDYQRFFFDRNLPGYFWMSRPWFYFSHSQLAARPIEILTSIHDGLPREAVYFNARPDGQATYWPGYPGRSEQPSLWVRQFGVFYLPRPWWGWMSRIAPERRPVDFATFLILCAGLVASGGSLLLVSLRTRLSQAAAVPECRDPAHGPKAARLELVVGATNHD